MNSILPVGFITSALTVEQGGNIPLLESPATPNLCRLAVFHLPPLHQNASCPESVSLQPETSYPFWIEGRG